MAARKSWQSLKTTEEKLDALHADLELVKDALRSVAQELSRQAIKLNQMESSGLAAGKSSARKAKASRG